MAILPSAPARPARTVNAVANGCAKQYAALLGWNSRNHLRGLGVNLLLCTTSLTVFFGGAEALARLQYTPQKVEYNGIFEYDREKVFRLRPNLKAEYAGAPFHTNRFGHRGRNISVEKPAGTRRVLVLGDSISFGHGVRDHETYPAHLEWQLREHFADSEETIEVINAAAPGNSSYQEYHDLKRGLKFEPDLVVLQITLNDIIEQHPGWIFKDMHWLGSTWDTSNHGQQIAGYLLGSKRLSHTDHVLKQHSALYLFLKDMAARIRFNDASGGQIAANAKVEETALVQRLVEEPRHPDVLAAWDTALKWIGAIIEEAEEADIPLMLVVTPFDFQLPLPKDKAYPQKILQNFAQERGILYVDMLTALREEFAESIRSGDREDRDTDTVIARARRKNPEKLDEFWSKFFIDEDHPSPEGHALTANVLAPALANTLKEAQ